MAVKADPTVDLFCKWQYHGHYKTQRTNKQAERLIDNLGQTDRIKKQKEYLKAKCFLSSLIVFFGHSINQMVLWQDSKRKQSIQKTIILAMHCVNPLFKSDKILNTH